VAAVGSSATLRAFAERSNDTWRVQPQKISRKPEPGSEAQGEALRIPTGLEKLSMIQHELARAFIERAEALNLKGKKRDDA
jgi:3-polyprenyl-4-hydroxybenzoate decarboxylase